MDSVIFFTLGALVTFLAGDAIKSVIVENDKNKELAEELAKVRAENANVPPVS
jgi:ABC-type Zn uptake system ZnuABC Zn-binding protein ZnuA